MLNIKGHDILLVKTKVIGGLVREKIKESMQRGNIKIYESEITDERILSSLLENQYLYGKRRQEGTFNKIINFPEYIVEEDREGYGKSLTEELHSMVKGNIDSKVKCEGLTNVKKIPLETLKDLDFDFKENRKNRGLSGIRAYGKELDETLRKISGFLDTK